MSITDELRKWAEKNECKSYCKLLTDIADRIDAEHESACCEAYGNGVMSVPIALDESQWAKLPVDADGVPIRVGDVLTDGEYTFVVDELAAFGDGSWSIRNEDGNAWAACDVTHHHEPTVEDVLREFGKGWHERMVGPETFDIADYVEQYAARLRLAGDAE